MIYSILLTVAVGCFCLWAGGWPWVLLAVLSLALHWPWRNPAQLFWASLVSLVWVGIYLWNGDRRMYFPFTLAFSLQAFAHWAVTSTRQGWLAAIAVVALFSAIRLIQAAPLIVLAVELVVAAVAVALPAIWLLRGQDNTNRRIGAAAAASVLAFAGLIF